MYVGRAEIVGQENTNGVLTRVAQAPRFSVSGRSPAWWAHYRDRAARNQPNLKTKSRVFRVSVSVLFPRKARLVFLPAKRLESGLPSLI